MNGFITIINDIIYDFLNKGTRANFWQGLFSSHRDMKEVSGIKSTKRNISGRITVLCNCIIN